MWQALGEVNLSAFGDTRPGMLYNYVARNFPQELHRAFDLVVRQPCFRQCFQPGLRSALKVSAR